MTLWNGSHKLLIVIFGITQKHLWIKALKWAGENHGISWKKDNFWTSLATLKGTPQ